MSVSPIQRDILYEATDGVAVIRFNRPQALNAMTVGMMEALSAAFDRAAADAAVRAIVLTGEGRAFCTGADLGATQAKPPVDHNGKLDLGYILDRHYNPLILKMRALAKPVIAAINGMAAGAGANFGLMADLVICARSSYFLQAFVNVGLIPDAGGTWILPRSVGPQRAMGLALLGEKLPADTARDWGLVWDVVDDEALMPHVTVLARRLAQGPGVALRNIKRAIHGAAGRDLAAALDLESDLQRECGQTRDFMEGAIAFMEKRKPVFEGC